MSLTITGRAWPPTLRSISAPAPTRMRRSSRASAAKLMQSPSGVPYTTPGTWPLLRRRRETREPNSSRTVTSIVGRLLAMTTGECSRRDRALPRALSSLPGMANDDLPQGRVRRTARLGTVIGSEGARYAGTRAANLARSKERANEALDARHLEAAERMVDVLGTMKGAAMKIGQLASFIDTEFIPEEYRELYQDKLATLRSEAPSM